MKALAFVDVNPTGTCSDRGTGAPEARDSTALTRYAWDPDDTLASRTDDSLGTLTFGYDWAKHLVNVSSPLYSGSTTYSGGTTFAWRDDGLLGAKTLPGEQSGVTGSRTNEGVVRGS
ncbi:MAG TPA: hypothetical protein VFW92_08370 [Candidatus Limnocylindrales bacterium]|nr:hypothetical protein [Candidatus Limnocylindrales bacterium]